MSKIEKVTIHDGRGNAYSMEAPRGGGQVIVDFNGPIVCLKSVDYYGDVKNQVCVPIPQPTTPVPVATGKGGKNGCGCP